MSLGFVLSLAAGWLWVRMGMSDREHARFLSCGKDVNRFLKEYGRSVAEAHEQGNLCPLLALYTDDFHAPARGSWRLGPSHSLGYVSRSVLERRGSANGDRKLVEEDLASYLEGIAAIDSVKIKINLIE